MLEFNVTSFINNLCWFLLNFKLNGKGLSCPSYFKTRSINVYSSVVAIAAFSIVVDATLPDSISNFVSRLDAFRQIFINRIRIFWIASEITQHMFAQDPFAAYSAHTLSFKGDVWKVCEDLVIVWFKIPTIPEAFKHFFILQENTMNKQLF